MNRIVRLCLPIVCLLPSLAIIGADPIRSCNMCNPTLKLTCQQSGPYVLNGTSFLEVNNHVWLSVCFRDQLRMYEFYPDKGCVSEPIWEKTLPSRLGSSPYLVYNGTSAYLVMFGGNWTGVTPEGFIQVYPFDVETGHIAPTPTYEVLELPYYYYRSAKLQNETHLYLAYTGGVKNGSQYVSQFAKVYSFDFATGTVEQTDTRAVPDGSSATGIAWFDGSKKYLAYGQDFSGTITLYAFDMTTGKLGALSTDSITLTETPYPEGLSFLQHPCQSYLAVANAGINLEIGTIKIFAFDPLTGTIKHTPTDERYLSGPLGQIFQASWPRFIYYFGAVGRNGLIGLYLFNPVTGKLSPEPASETYPEAEAQTLDWYNGKNIYMLAGGNTSDYPSETSGYMNIYKIVPKSTGEPCCTSSSTKKNTSCDGNERAMVTVL